MCAFFLIVVLHISLKVAYTYSLSENGVPSTRLTNAATLSVLMLALLSFRTMLRHMWGVLTASLNDFKYTRRLLAKLWHRKCPEGSSNVVMWYLLSAYVLSAAAFLAWCFGVHVRSDLDSLSRYFNCVVFIAGVTGVGIQ